MKGPEHGRALQSWCRLASAALVVMTLDLVVLARLPLCARLGLDTRGGAAREPRPRRRARRSHRTWAGTRREPRPRRRARRWHRTWAGRHRDPRPRRRARRWHRTSAETRRGPRPRSPRPCAARPTLLLL